MAGGPARDMDTDVFRLHMAGLEVQGSADVDVVTCHDIVPDPGGPRWHHGKIEAVARSRQRFLEEAEGFDALFMVDADVIVGEGVLARLLEVESDVVYGVFWTEDDWGQPEGPVAPQVWRAHPYGFDAPTWEALKAPGVNEVEVYGGGACTLLRGRAFESSYFPLLESVRWLGGMWAGEDRTFCLGLETRGIRQVALTGLPIVHMYGRTDVRASRLDAAKHVERHPGPERSVR